MTLVTAHLAPPSTKVQRPEPALLRRLAVTATGFVPVTLIAATAFGVADLRDLAVHVLVPMALAAIVIVRCDRLGAAVLSALVAGMAATALYDVLRFGFLWSGAVPSDPIPHIGEALGLRPAWLVGYLWRYVGNGGGLAVAFVLLGLRGARAGVVYGLAVCGGLLATLALAPHGEETLFPLTVATVVMAVGGHVLYGTALGVLTNRLR